MNKFLSKEEYKAHKALDEARKAGKAEPEVDEEGKEINPHMPHYLIQAPWYWNPKGPTLKHHKQLAPKTKTKLENWYQRGKFLGCATKYRKGACDNCGAMTHSTKECTDRPRKLGAKFTGKDIRPDEIIEAFELDYDAKRDRYNGYDPEMYEEVIEEGEKYEEIRKKVKMEQLQSENPEDDDEFKEKDFENNAPIANRDPKIKTTTRNLRLIEDPAKYLINMNQNTAYYDPKSRAMRGNPTAEGEDDQNLFKGDNAYKYTGESYDALKQEAFVWEQVEKNNAELNNLALPTGTQKVFQMYTEQEKKKIFERNKKIFQIYDIQQEKPQLEDEVLGQTEQYKEYALDGKGYTAKSRPRNKSKYEEDVYINNHTSVWGS